MKKKLSERLEELLEEYPDYVHTAENAVLKNAIRDMKKRERPVEGMSQGKIDKIKREIKRKREKGVPTHITPEGELERIPVWSEDEIYVEAYEVNGMACPSSPNAQGMQTTEKKRQEDIPG
jgi:hypothetical protein